MFSAMYPLFLPGLQPLIADAVLASSKHVQGLRKQRVWDWDGANTLSAQPVPWGRVHAWNHQNFTKAS